MLATERRSSVCERKNGPFGLAFIKPAAFLFLLIIASFLDWAF
jgi:hypothetical protein